MRSRWPGRMAMRSGIAIFVIYGGARAAAPISAADSGTAAQTPDRSAYALQRAYRPGDVDRYRIEFHTVLTDAQTGLATRDVVFTTTLKETTRDVRPNGDIVFIDEAEEAYLKFGEQERDATDALPRLTVTQDRQGHLLHIKAAAEHGTFASGGRSIIESFLRAPAAFYPPKPVQVGDEWKIDYSDLLGKEKGSEVSGTAMAVGTEVIGGVQTLRIKVATDAKTAGKTGETTHFEGIGNIDTATGKFMRMTGTVEGGGGPLGKNKADVTLMLLPEKQA